MFTLLNTNKVSESFLQIRMLAKNISLFYKNAKSFLLRVDNDTSFIFKQRPVRTIFHNHMDKNGSNV